MSLFFCSVRQCAIIDLFTRHFFFGRQLLIVFLFCLFIACYPGIFIASYLQYSLFIGWRMVFVVTQHPTHCIPCIQVRHTMFTRHF